MDWFVFTVGRTLRNVDIFREFGVRYSGENLDLMTAEMAFLRIDLGQISPNGSGSNLMADSATMLDFAAVLSGGG